MVVVAVSKISDRERNYVIGQKMGVSEDITKAHTGNNSSGLDASGLDLLLLEQDRLPKKSLQWNPDCLRTNGANGRWRDGIEETVAARQLEMKNVTTGGGRNMALTVCNSE